MQSPAVSVVQLGTDIPSFSASSTLFPALRSSDALIGSDLGRQLRPTVLSLLSGQMLTTKRADVQPEGIPTNRSLILSLSPDVEVVPSCIIQLGQFEVAQDRIPELLAQLRVTNSPLLGRAILMQQFDLVEQYRASALQFVPLTLGLIGGVAAALVNAARSREFATYRLSGTSRTSLLVILLVEEIMLGLTLTAGASMATAVLWTRLLGPLESLSYAFAAGALLTCFALVGSLPGALRSAAVLSKDR
ncbi:hypothetical protein [Curtobacterium sp. SGAir0471]|uniref:hypothetical protein n=1 Tax=Curtobacterium sp. SGAir0471 TaxID=2070337 RepID=UPI0010F8B937|nr:hypothetical protein [Curtobacterium sp. SGAir0471]